VDDVVMSGMDYIISDGRTDEHLLPSFLHGYFMVISADPSFHSFRIFLKCLFKATTTDYSEALPTTALILCWNLTRQSATGNCE